MNNIFQDKSTRVVIHYPNTWLLNQICFKGTKKKIVWNRNDKNPNQIALNEWPSVKIFKIIFALPFLAFVLVTFIPALIVLIIIHFFKKEKSENFQQKYFDFLRWLAKSQRNTFNNDFFDLAKSFEKQSKYKGLLRVLYIDQNRKEILLKIDSKRINEFVDEVWIYESIEKVIRVLVHNEYSLEHSFISTFNETEGYCEIEWLNESNSKIKNERERLETNKKLLEKENEPQHPRIVLNANNFLNNDIVFYFESNHNKKVNDFILKKYDYIKERLSKKSLHFIYIPKNIFENKVLYKDLSDYASYINPEVFSLPEQDKTNLLESIFNNIEVELYYKGIAQSLNIPEMHYPVFLHSVELETGINPHRKYSYSVYELKGEYDGALKIDIEYYLSVVSIVQSPCYRIVEPDYEDPDEMFPAHSQEISRELKNKIDSLIEFKNEKLILASIVYMVNSLKVTQPQLCKKINSLLFDNIANKSILSRLFIDDRHRIFLTDYDNLEIELAPLPKALYIFMLKNPEGVRLKELSNHREELIDIYSKVGNRLDMDQIKKSVNDLIDAKSNSVNEKCSRIKEAFVSKIDNSIAQQYYITGKRSENKRIQLDRSLVLISQTK